MNKTVIVDKKVQLTQLEVKQYFEMLNKYIAGNGITSELTYAALKTIKSLEKDYNEINAAMYNPDTDPKFAEYKQKVNDAIVKFADRDEQGSIVVDGNKNPVIKEQIVEYQNEVKKLQEEYIETLKLVNGANDYNKNVLAQPREVTLYTWKNIHEVPEEIPGVFMYYMFKEEF